MIKKLHLIFLIMATLLCACTRSTSKTTYTKEEFLKLPSEKIVTILKDNGLELPSDYKDHPNLVIEFMDTFMKKILDGEFDHPDIAISYQPTVEMIQRIQEILKTKGFIQEK